MHKVLRLLSSASETKDYAQDDSLYGNPSL